MKLLPNNTEEKSEQYTNHKWKVNIINNIKELHNKTMIKKKSYKNWTSHMYKVKIFEQMKYIS